MRRAALALAAAALATLALGAVGDDAVVVTDGPPRTNEVLRDLLFPDGPQRPSSIPGAPAAAARVSTERGA